MLVIMNVKVKVYIHLLLIALSFIVFSFLGGGDRVPHLASMFQTLPLFGFPALVLRVNLRPAFT